MSIFTVNIADACVAVKATPSTRRLWKSFMSAWTTTSLFTVNIADTCVAVTAMPVEQTIKLLTIVLSIYKLPWENYLAVLEVLILVCTSALPRGTLSTCCSDTPILGSGHVRFYTTLFRHRTDSCESRVQTENFPHACSPLERLCS